MKKSVCMLLSFLLVVCIAVPATAQEPVYDQYDSNGLNDVTTVDINAEWQGMSVYAEDHEGTAAVVQVGTVYWRITRQASNLQNCILEAHYEASPGGSSVSYLRFNSLEIGTSFDFDRYKVFPYKMYHFDFPVLFGNVTIGNLNIPTSVSRVAVQQIGLQVYELDRGIWSLPGMGGQWVTVVSP